MNLSFTLMGDEATLIERARQRDENANPCFVVLEKKRALTNTFKIDTGNKRPEEVVEEMLAIICKA